MLEAMRRVLLRIVRLHNVAVEWPWDTTPGESLAPSSPIHLAPAAVPFSPAAGENPTTPTPRERGNGLYVEVGKTPGIKHAILASIDALINVGMPPKQSVHALTSWPARSCDLAWMNKAQIDPKPVASAVIRGLLPLMEQKGLEMSVLRLVMEVLGAACILLRDLEICLPGIADSMVLRLRREGVTSRVEQQKIEECSNLGMHSNETKVDTADSSEEAEGAQDQTTSDWDDDSWDDESGVVCIDTLVGEFGKFLMALSAHYPAINTTEGCASNLTGMVTPGKRPMNSVIEYLATSTTSPCCWPGLSDENARILNWVLVTACAQPES